MHEIITILSRPTEQRQQHVEDGDDKGRNKHDNEL